MSGSKGASFFKEVKAVPGRFVHKGESVWGPGSVQSSHPVGSSVPAGSETRRKARLSFKENSENFPQPQLLFFF